MSEFPGGPYLLQNSLAYLRKYNDYPCPFPVTVDYSLRHFAEMFVSILALHGLDPNLIDQYPAVLQVVHDWACRMRTPDPHGFVDALAAILLKNPPMPTYAFTDQHIVRLTAIVLAAIGAVQGGRDTSLAAEAAFLQLPITSLVCRSMLFREKGQWPTRTRPLVFSTSTIFLQHQGVYLKLKSHLISMPMV
jgi:hypothetical protein